MFGFQGLFVAVQRRELHLLVGLELAAALQPGDLVRLEQGGHAAGELLHHFVLALVHGVQIQAQFAHAHAVIGERVLRLMVLPGGIQQRLGRNTAHVQAGAAECRLVLFVDALLDAGRVVAQLRAANRGDVTAGAAADDDDIVFISHN